MTYGGDSLIPALQVGAPDNNDGNASIFYLDNASTATNAELVITAGTSDFIQYDFDMFSISGLAAGGPFATDTDADGGDTSLSLTGSDGGFMLGSIGTNGGPTLTATPTGTTTGGDRAENYHWVNTSSATTYTYSATGTDTVGVMASFAVPEPSTFSLLGLAGLLLFLRRRR